MIEPTNVTLAMVVEAAMKDVMFMDLLIADPADAMTKRGWRLTAPDMQFLVDLVGRDSVKNLAAAMHMVFTDLRDDQVQMEALGEPWRLPKLIE